MKAKPYRQPTLVFILKRGDKVLGTSPDEMWANALADVLNREQPGVTVEQGPLEETELLLRIDSKNNGNGTRTADSK